MTGTEPSEHADDARGAVAPVAPGVLADLLRDQLIRNVALTGPDALPNRIDLTLPDGRCVALAAQALAAAGRSVTAALRTETAHGPLDVRPANADSLARTLRGHTVRRVAVTGTPSAYHVLIIVDSGEQVSIEAHAMPTNAGRPVLRFGLCDDAPGVNV